MTANITFGDAMEIGRLDGHDQAARRIDQLRQMGLDPEPTDVAAQLAERDRLDESRATAPLKPAPDAIVVDSSRFGVDDEVSYILDLIAQRS